MATRRESTVAPPSGRTDDRGTNASPEPARTPAAAGHAATHASLESLWRRPDQVRTSHDAGAEPTTHSHAQRVIQTLPQLFWLAQANRQWHWASAQWIAYTGQPDACSHGDGWLLAVHEQDRDGLVAAWKAAGGAQFQTAVRLRHGDDGHYRWFRLSAAARRGENTRLVEWAGTFDDIDELVAERELNAQRRSELETLVGERTQDLKRALEQLHGHAQPQT